MSPNEVIPRRTLHEELASLLRTMIIEGELSPGERIPEQALCERFGVSRTPLREALMVLSAEKLVRLAPNRGATVVRITSDAAAEILPLLGTLEGHAAELACARIDDSRVGHLRQIFEQAAERHANDDAEGFVRLCRRFAEAVFDAGDNMTLLETYRLLNLRVQRLVISKMNTMARHQPGQWRKAIEERRQMLEALEARDADAYAHLARTYTLYRAASLSAAREPVLSS